MSEPKSVTHRDRIPRGMCSALMMKHILTHALDEPMALPRPHPGDGYYWCSKTCRPVGPDDELVAPEACNPERGCYDGPQS